jgi:hypothetical protein
MILCKNLTGVSWVMFTTSITSIHLVNVSTVTNRNLNPPGSLGKVPMISISHGAKGQERSIGRRGFACVDVCF